MAVRSTNAHWKLSEIHPRHWDAVVKQAGLGKAAGLIHEVIDQAPAAIEGVNRQLPAGFPSRVRDRILMGVQEQVKRLAG